MLRCWFSVDSNRPYDTLAKSGPKGTFLSARDCKEVAHVLPPISYDYEAGFEIHTNLGALSLGLHTTDKGFAIWCRDPGAERDQATDPR